MPIYDYLCRACGHLRRDDFYQLHREAPASMACPACDHQLERMPGAPVMMLPYNERPPIDGAHNIFEGTGLADSDGKNRAHYKSEKIQVDYGKKTTHGGRTHA